MKILFDANTPAKLSKYFRFHDVQLATEIGWDRLPDGRLLELAEQDGFEILVTCDKNLRYQQNLTGRKIALVVLWSNRWPVIRPFVIRIATAVEFAQRGQTLELDPVSLER